MQYTVIAKKKKGSDCLLTKRNGNTGMAQKRNYRYVSIHFTFREFLMRPITYSEAAKVIQPANFEDRLIFIFLVVKTWN